MGWPWTEPIAPTPVDNVSCRVTAVNMRVVAASLRRMAEEASGEDRRALRGLVVRADELRDDIERLLT